MILWLKNWLKWFPRRAPKSPYPQMSSVYSSAVLYVQNFNCNILYQQNDKGFFRICSNAHTNNENDSRKKSVMHFLVINITERRRHLTSRSRIYICYICIYSYTYLHNVHFVRNGDDSTYRALWNRTSQRIIRFNSVKLTDYRLKSYWKLLKNQLINESIKRNRNSRNELNLRVFYSGSSSPDKYRTFSETDCACNENRKHFPESKCYCLPRGSSWRFVDKIGRSKFEFLRRG